MLPSPVTAVYSSMGFCRWISANIVGVHHQRHRHRLTASTSYVRRALHYWLTTHPRVSPNCCGGKYKDLSKWPARGGWGLRGLVL